MRDQKLQPLRVILLMPPSFREFGGIAQYCRDLVSAIANDRTFGQHGAVPPSSHLVCGELSLRCVEVDRKRPWVSLHEMIQGMLHRGDIVLCAHRDVLPLAYILARMNASRIVLFAHGIEAWKPFPDSLRQMLSKVARVVCVSDHTRKRMNEWALLPLEQYRLLPCAVDVRRIAGSSQLCSGRLSKTMITIARLDSRERYKGIDEVLSLCPRLFTQFPLLRYVIVGDGDDRQRLEQRARELGLGDRVHFYGRLDEAKKLTALRDADAFVMPGRGEGFGIVYLEAMACGVPVVASRLDGSQEAVLHGRIGRLVDPDCPEDLFQGIVGALNTEKHVPAELEYFSIDRFKERLLAILNEVAESSRG